MVRPHALLVGSWKDMGLIDPVLLTSTVANLPKAARAANNSVLADDSLPATSLPICLMSVDKALESPRQLGENAIPIELMGIQLQIRHSW